MKCNEGGEKNLREREREVKKGRKSDREGEEGRSTSEEEGDTQHSTSEGEGEKRGFDGSVHEKARCRV